MCCRGAWSVRVNPWLWSSPSATIVQRTASRSSTCCGTAAPSRLRSAQLARPPSPHCQTKKNQTLGTWLRPRQQDPCCLTMFDWKPAGVSGPSQHLTLPPVPPPVPACAQPPGSSALGPEHSQALGLAFPVPRTQGQAAKALEVPVSQPGDEGRLVPARFPAAPGSVPRRGPLQGLRKRITGPGLCSPSGLKLCPSGFSSRIRKPQVSKPVLTLLVSASTCPPGPQGGCKWLFSAPSLLMLGLSQGEQYLLRRRRRDSPCEISVGELRFSASCVASSSGVGHQGPIPEEH